jgi:hypothetical protein
MRRLAIVIAALLLAGDAYAIERYQTTSMSCARVQAALDSQGQAILRYPARNNPSLVLFDRYVRDRTFCSSSQRADLQSVPAADTPNCGVRKCVRASGSASGRGR